MNPMTNEVIDGDEYRKRLDFLMAEKDGTVMNYELRDFEPLPNNLQRAAKKKLKGRKSAFVSKTSGGKLSRWASMQRKKKRKKKKFEKSQMVAGCQSYYNKLDNNI